MTFFEDLIRKSPELEDEGDKITPLALLFSASRDAIGDTVENNIDHAIYFFKAGIATKILESKDYAFLRRYFRTTQTYALFYLFQSVVEKSKNEDDMTTLLSFAGNIFSELKGSTCYEFIDEQKSANYHFGLDWISPEITRVRKENLGADSLPIWDDGLDSACALYLSSPLRHSKFDRILMQLMAQSAWCNAHCEVLKVDKYQSGRKLTHTFISQIQGWISKRHNWRSKLVNVFSCLSILSIAIHPIWSGLNRYFDLHYSYVPWLISSFCAYSFLIIASRTLDERDNYEEASKFAISQLGEHDLLLTRLTEGTFLSTSYLRQQVTALPDVGLINAFFTLLDDVESRDIKSL